ncbi:MAG: type II toxin-antitoxin system HipA family toxin [Gammaproteobacteria bacterium]
MSDPLDVFLGGDRVGSLWLDPGRRFVFRYEANWLARADAFPLSLALPLRVEAFADDQARPFFSNLLPESELRRLIARRLGLSERNDFALLEAVGGECAGAVSLLSADVIPPAESAYRFLDESELNALITDLAQRPMLAGEQGMRLSLAGTQNKLPVVYEEGRVGLPMGSAPSSHILKPPIAHYPDSVWNECFCMRLASQVGLAVPPVMILAASSPLYLVRRYDRENLSGVGLRRVHQEDFCQALGIAPDQKYEREGGPGLRACFELLRRVSVQPVVDMKAMLEWVVFNYLIGNADAHGKNVSLLLTAQGPRLAPFYDLMSTAVYPGLSERMAMRVGGEDRPDWIIERRWRGFADEVGIGFKLLHQTLLGMKERVGAEARELAADLRAEHGEHDVIDQIVALVERRGSKVMKSLAAGTGGREG